jgi:hypothetical protein
MFLFDNHCILFIKRNINNKFSTNLIMYTIVNILKLCVVTTVPSADQLSVKAEALYDYQGRTEAELSFKKGQVMTNVRILEGPWWKGT